VLQCLHSAAFFLKKRINLYIYVILCIPTLYYIVYNRLGIPRAIFYHTDKWLRCQCTVLGVKNLLETRYILVKYVGGYLLCLKVWFFSSRRYLLVLCCSTLFMRVVVCVCVCVRINRCREIRADSIKNT